MRRALWIAIMLLAAGPAMGVPAGGAKGAATKSVAATARGPQFQAVTFRVRHRVFHEFWDMQTVKLGQDFPLGDTEFMARVVRYLPDFQMELPSRRAFSLSDQPRNPAFEVIVKKGKTPQDTTYAFLRNSPPHFGARSYFAFQVVRIDFADRPPLKADTTKAPAAMPSGHPPTGATQR